MLTQLQALFDSRSTQLQAAEYRNLTIIMIWNCQAPKASSSLSPIVMILTKYF